MGEDSRVDAWADGWDVRPLIEARLRRAKADALRDAATATLSMTYPTSADPDVWAAWLVERADAIESAHTLSDALAPTQPGAPRTETANERKTDG